MGNKQSSAKRGGVRAGVVTAVLAALVLVLVSESGSAKTPLALGPFAGYLLSAPVTSIGGSWVVPAVLPGSRLGQAANWVGAEGPSAFIQIGTDEARIESGGTPAHDVYTTFWSDTLHGYRPQLLFPVNPGDEITASMTLTGSHWHLDLHDKTSGARSAFVTTQEANGVFNQAEWPVEDVTDAGTKKPFPFPAIAPLGFHRLWINSQVPPFAQLQSIWMSTAGKTLGPTPLQHDGFAVQQMTLSTDAARYLRVALAADAKQAAFVTALQTWDATTPQTRIAASARRFATALRQNLATLASIESAPALAQLHQQHRRALLSVLAQTLAATTLAPGQLNSWRATWVRDALATGAVAQMVRRALGVPQLVRIP